MTDIILRAPLDGWSTSLSELPDPVFAERMLGDGVAIDPTSDTVHAPCEGQVVALPDSRHAITVRAAGDLDVLLHVGLETVALGGAGFEALVRVGDRVRSGEPLLRFDLDATALRARSLLTPMIIVTPGFRIVARHENRSVRAGDVLLELAGHALPNGTPPVVTTVSVSRRVTVGLEHGLHARPAARIAHELRSKEASVVLKVRDRAADARSVTSLMALGVTHAEEVTLEATGPDAAIALEAIARFLVEDSPAPSGAFTRQGRPHAQRLATEENTFVGIVANGGVAVGPAVQLRPQTCAVPEAGKDPTQDASELERARATVREALEKRRSSVHVTHSELAAAHLELLDDPAILATAHAALAAGKSAGFAWRRAIREQVAALERVDDEYLRERVADLLDLEAQVLLALGYTDVAGIPTLPEGAILLASDLLPSQFVALEPVRIGGICLAGGGPTAHVAILAAAVGLPMLVAIGDALLSVREGAVVILDANAGTLRTRPTQEQIEQAEAALAIARQLRQRALARACEEACMADGRRVPVYANLGSTEEAALAIAHGADGCGLLRTEFQFLDRSTAPDAEAQYLAYQAIATALAGRPLTIRTLDAGGDKPIAYLPQIVEENPALGLRGVRTSLRYRELLRTQLRAILRVRPAGQCRILLPMITDIDDLVAIRAELEALTDAEPESRAISVGVMIETPAAALLASKIAAHADHLSIGTNDLTQYVLAMDRGHPDLAARVDGLHPAVLKLVAGTVEGAGVHGREVAVCGNLAADPAALPILLGLGVHEISVVPTAIAAIKERIRSLDEAACRSLARRALECATATEVRALELT